MARKKSHHCNLNVRHIRERFNRQRLERIDASRNENTQKHEHKQRLMNGEEYNFTKHDFRGLLFN